MGALSLDGVQNYLDLGTLGTLGTDMTNGVYCKFKIKTKSTALGEFGMEHTTQCSGFIIGLNEGAQGVNTSGRVWVDVIDSSAAIHHIRGYTTAATPFNDGKVHTIEVTVNVSAKTMVIKVDDVSYAITYESQTTFTTFANFNAGWIVGASYFNGSISPTMPCIVDDLVIGYDSSHIYGSYSFEEGGGTTTANAGSVGGTATLTGSPVPDWVGDLSHLAHFNNSGLRPHAFSPGIAR